MGCSTSKPIAARPPTYSEWQPSTANDGCYSNYQLEGETKGDDSFWTSDRFSKSPILFSKNGKGSQEVTPAMTIPQMLQAAVAKSGNKPFLRVESVSSLVSFSFISLLFWFFFYFIFFHCTNYSEES